MRNLIAVVFCGTAMVGVGSGVKDAASNAAGQVQDSRVPEVVSMVPANCARDVDPRTDKIVITFDRPMSGGYSLCRGRGVSWNEHSESTGKPHWNADKTQITFPVKLRSGWRYRMSINHGKANNFRSADGVPVQDLDYVFRTSGPTDPAEDLPKVVKIEPANGAKGVDSATKAIVVTFDQEMQDGCWSVCRSNAGTWDDYPEIDGKISYDKSCRVLTIPVKLKPGKTYKLQLNNGEACNIVSKDDKSLVDYPYSFTTAP